MSADLRDTDVRGLPAGHHRRACPVCNRAKRDTALNLTVRPDGTGVYLCHRCGYAGAVGARSIHKLTPPMRPARESVHAVLSTWGCELWNSCEQVSGEARAYLEARRCVIPPKDGDLRWHPNLKHPSGYEGPALVALVTHAVTKLPMSLHRTWVLPDGRKPDVEPTRLLLKGHKKAGGVIRLWPDEAVTTGLAVAEGIETSLAAAHVKQPVWSLLDAGNLAEFPALGGIECLSIFADHDDAGIRAAEKCAQRWHEAGVEVRITIPNERGKDIADLVRDPE